MGRYSHIKTYIAVLTFILTGQWIMAETVTLRSGKVVAGQVILQNDDVIILKDATGARFQFPMDDVEKVEQTPTETAVISLTEKQAESLPKVALRINLTGGGCAIRDTRLSSHNAKQGILGGNMSAELQIGSRSLMDKRIFVGGSIGYMGVFANAAYSLIPLKAVVSVPLLNGTHAPEIGINLGYALGTKSIRGGLTGGADVNWRYQISSKLAILLGYFAYFTQTTMPIEESIDGTIYSHQVGRTMVQFGIKTTIQF